MRAADYHDFAAALCDADIAMPEGLRSPAGTDLADRFAVYCNTVHVSLVDSLAARFPITLAQVGEDFFRAMARAFVQKSKPAIAVLTLYGEDFPDFIATFEPAVSLAWLPDLAALERAWSQCWAAADAPALPITALRIRNADELLQVCVYVHPAARLVRSEWPVADLWDAHQCAVPDLSTLEWRPQNVLLCRPQADVLMLRMDDAAADFIAALIAGDTIESAAALSPDLDVGALLRVLFDAGFILEIRT
jgi:hypothetical protein